MTSLEEAQDWVRANADFGVNCPCCGRLTKIYKRTLNAAMIRALARFYLTYNLDWGHSEVARNKSGDLAKTRWWGLLEKASEPRPDGGISGIWRVTPKGKDFLYGRISVPKRALVLHNELLRLDDSRGYIDAKQALNERFDYGDLMNA